jgi:hypothetical protein
MGGPQFGHQIRAAQPQRAGGFAFAAGQADRGQDFGRPGGQIGAALGHGPGQEKLGPGR